MSHDHGAHERIDALMRRIEALERAQARPAPIRVPVQSPPREFVNTCAKCGLELGRTMHCACPHNDCPCGLGPAISWSTAP